MQLNEITFHSPRISRNIDLLFLADTHGKRCECVWNVLKENHVDAVVCTGDVCNRHRKKPTVKEIRLFAELAKKVPVFFSAGNHDNIDGDTPMDALSEAGVHVLCEREEPFMGIRIGGASSLTFHPELTEATIGFVRRFCREEGDFRLLLCHHPEYFDRFFGGLCFDLMLSGHAHGGQIRLFGHGLFAPGQGVLPRYTSGLYRERLLVSRGMANHTLVPRLFNHTEMILLHLRPEGVQSVLTAD